MNYGNKPKKRSNKRQRKSIRDNNSPASSWMDDTIRLIKFRLDRMVAGDWLISHDQRWRIECSILQKADTSCLLYRVLHDGVELFSRQRTSALLNNLIAYQAPVMTLHPQINAWGLHDYASYNSAIVESDVTLEGYDITGATVTSTIDMSKLDTLPQNKIEDIIDAIIPEVALTHISIE